jgi:hypothetical protein
MDDELFRSYFKKMYRHLVNMECQFMSMMGPTERSGFFAYSKSLSDLATFFKCDR